MGVSAYSHDNCYGESCRYIQQNYGLVSSDFILNKIKSI